MQRLFKTIGVVSIVVLTLMAIAQTSAASATEMKFETEWLVLPGANIDANEILSPNYVGELQEAFFKNHGRLLKRIRDIQAKLEFRYSSDFANYLGRLKIRAAEAVHSFVGHQGRIGSRGYYEEMILLKAVGFRDDDMYLVVGKNTKDNEKYVALAVGTDGSPWRVRLSPYTRRYADPYPDRKDWWILETSHALKPLFIALREFDPMILINNRGVHTLPPVSSR